ncbi:MAG: PL29 family lyase N-terminal domain-containing protein [Phocaeicola sp.]
MRNYKSLILAGLLAFGFSSCNTDDLEKDIDDLANRVADFEAQVLKLNDEMNIIRVLMDGNKTITKYTVEGDKYVLTLSNGETITLTQGNDGVTYPKVEIIGGNWYVDGSDTGIKAEAEDGIDTPQPPVFKIESGNWHVSYDGGKTYEDLKVSATETGTQGESPISDFKLEGNKFVFTIGSNIYEIPVIEDLTCQIAEESDMVTIAQGATREVKINVNLKAGDLVRAIAPVEWKAVVSDYSALTGEQELTVSVTAPSVASKGVLTVEVTRGVNTITDEIVLKTGVTSYYDEYMAGMDIVIGDLVVNKYNFSNYKVVSGGSLVYEEGTILYFIDGDVTWDASNNGNIIVIAKDKGVYPAVTATARVALNGTADSVGFVCHGVTFKSTNAGNSTFSLSGASKLNRFYFTDCKIQMVKDQSFTYLYGGELKPETESKIDNILFESCYFSIPSHTNSTKALDVLNLRRGYFENSVVRNNVFYCSDVSGAILVNVLGYYNNQGFFTNVHVDNNTFINVLGNHGGSGSGFLKITMDENCTFTNNLFWYNNEVLGSASSGGWESHSNLISATNNFNYESVENNIVYSAAESTGIDWRYFRTTPSGWAGFKNAIELEKVNPFTDGTVPHTGTFTYTDEFKAKGIGANIQ